MTQKAASKKMIDLDAKKIVSTVKIIYLDAEVSVEKTMVALVFEINTSSIHTAMTLINQDIIVLFQIVVLVSEIRFLGTVVFLLVPWLVDIVIKDEYLWILYQKFGQF